VAGRHACRHPPERPLRPRRRFRWLPGTRAVTVRASPRRPRAQGWLSLRAGRLVTSAWPQATP
jgi:hypothetical protein